MDKLQRFSRYVSVISIVTVLKIPLTTVIYRFTDPDNNKIIIEKRYNARVEYCQAVRCSSQKKLDIPDGIGENEYISCPSPDQNTSH